MLIGIVGAPNKGKSRFFSCVSKLDVQVANYPFTTIDPDRAVAYLKVPCPSKELGIISKPRTGKLEDGMRDVPIQLMDVAGLVPGAHEGNGMGNKFLDDLSSADGFVHIIDASGKTDLTGQPAHEFEIEKEVLFLDEELRYWILGILKKNAPKFKGRTINELHAVLSGLSYSKNIVLRCARNCQIDEKRIEASDTELEKLSVELSKNAKPKIIVANKADLEGALERAQETAKKLSVEIIPASAQYEYVLSKAREKGIIRYAQGEKEFSIIGNPDTTQTAALEKISKFMKKNNGTGVYTALEKLVFEKIGMIVVYPVEDENAFSDAAGNVLPDAVLMPKESTVIELAAKVHQDLADKFIGAIDAREKRRVAKDHPLKNGDIIKIIRGK